MRNRLLFLCTSILCSPDPDPGGGGSPAPAAPASSPPGSLLGGGAPPPAAAPAPVPAAPAPGTAPAGFRDQILGPDGKFNPDFVSFLPDDLKTHAATLGRFPDVTELARSYVQARSKLGERLAPPSESSTPEQVKAWREHVGAPETPEGYGIKKPDQLPKGVVWDDGMVKDFTGLAHKHHLPPGAVQEILGWYTGKSGEAVEAAQAQEEQWYQQHLATQEQELRQAWGDKMDTNFGQALKAARTFGLPSDKPSDWTPKDVVMALHRAASLISEDKFVVPGNGSAGKTAKQAAMEIMDPSNADRTARAYRGEFGAQEQQTAQQYLTQLLANAEKESPPGI